MLGDLLDLGQLATFEQVPELVAEHAADAGLAQARLYLADLRSIVLRELTGRGLDAGQDGQEFGIDSSLPGRAFRDVCTVTAAAPGDDGRVVHWTPVLNGTERLGVLRASILPGDDAAATRLRQLAALLGLLLVSKRELSDSYARLVRSQPMTVAAEMQWHLMPPSSFANQRVVIGAGMEPAYEVGGDAFDYAIAGDIVHAAVFDAMGHDTAAGLASNLSIAACRNYRRQNADLITIGREIERVLVEQFDPVRFVTAILADFDTRTGELSWVNYGHHLPVVVRGGRWTSSLPCPPAHPLGTNLGLTATVCHEQLEPGDRLLLYTDGVTEARDATGHEFGLSRFVDFVVRHHADGLAVPETLRRLMRALIEHHRGRLQDDATVVFLEWAGAEQPNLRI